MLLRYCVYVILSISEANPSTLSSTISNKLCSLSIILTPQLLILIYFRVIFCPSFSVFCVSRCWMLNNEKTKYAHLFTNVALEVILVLSGFVMLFLVYRQIRTRDEWRQNRVAFLSIWGLSCLFGTMWALTFLEICFLPAFADFIRILACFFTSFQGLCSDVTVTCFRWGSLKTYCTY